MKDENLGYIDWDFTLEQIRVEKCALLLGPDVSTHPLNQSFHPAFKEYLNEKGDSPLFYYSEDEFFSFQSFKQEKRTASKIKTFFDYIPSNDLHEKIAEIPFHLVIHLSPDQLLKDSFEKRGIPHQFGYYRKGETQKNQFSPPTSENPILYNLLGSVEDSSSTVYTYKALFEYLESLFGDNQLPSILRQAITGCDHFIFLGIQYEKWYLKLLLRLLKLHEEKIIEACSKLGKLDEEETAFYSEIFDVEFIEVNFPEFIYQLHHQASKRSLLRSQQGLTDGDSPQRLVQALIEQGNHKKALDICLKIAEDQNSLPLKQEVILLTGRLANLSSEIQLNTIEPGEARREKNRLAQAILKLIQDIPFRFEN